jgi:hypothetical protein
MPPSLPPLILWTPLHQSRLNAYQLLATCRGDMARIDAVVETLPTIDALERHLQALRREKKKADRFLEEAYIASFEQRRHRLGLPKLRHDDHYRLRRAGLGLEGGSELFDMWEQAVARYYAKPVDKVPQGVRLLITGAGTLEIAVIKEQVAVLLADEEILRRRKKYPPEEFPDLKHQVIRQWAASSGVELQQNLEAIEQMLTRDRDRRLSAAPTAPFVPLAPSMVDKARQLAARIAPDDRVLAYLVFRVLQRAAAKEVDGRVQWDSRWFRGKKTSDLAIPGAGGKQKQLEKIRREDIMEHQRGHSGAAAGGVATTYRLRFKIERGSVRAEDVAQMLDVPLDSELAPKRRGKK